MQITPYLLSAKNLERFCGQRIRSVSNGLLGEVMEPGKFPSVDLRTS
jgi:hypothetical protein